VLAIAAVTMAIAAGIGGSASANSAGVASTPCAAGSDAAAQQQALHHAGLVVVLPDRVESFCIEFAGDTITGTELLEQSGLSIVFAGFGGLGGGVCRIEDVGCSDPGNCFCQCQGADCAYWSYFALEDGAWTYENVGPAQHRLHDGDVDGWVWGDGRAKPGAGGPCPTTPTPTVGVPASTPTPSGGQIVTPRVTAAEVNTAPSASSITAEALATPTPLPTLGPRSGTPSAKRADSGVPVGLIAFGVVAGVLVAGTGGLLAWRRIRG
jgi:hypothetical protein